MVFRPFKGEIIVGKISSASEAGMKSQCRIPTPDKNADSGTVRLDFFEDILVPENMMFPGSVLYVHPATPAHPLLSN